MPKGAEKSFGGGLLVSYCHIVLIDTEDQTVKSVPVMQNFLLARSGQDQKLLGQRWKYEEDMHDAPEYCFYQTLFKSFMHVCLIHMQVFSPDLSVLI